MRHTAVHLLRLIGWVSLGVGVLVVAVLATTFSVLGLVG